MRVSGFYNCIVATVSMVDLRYSSLFIINHRIFLIFDILQNVFNWLWVDFHSGMV